MSHPANWLIQVLTERQRVDLVATHLGKHRARKPKSSCKSDVLLEIKFSEGPDHLRPHHQHFPREE